MLMKRLLHIPLVGTVLVALATLLPRILGLRDFLTTDEAYGWITRTNRFSAALAAGNWADTNLIGHPGVTIMWLGAFGQRLEYWAIQLGLAAPTDTLGYLAWLRLGPVFAHTMLISIGYVLLRRLVAPTTALIAALLWATGPFLVANGRILHLDALLTNLIVLTLLSALLAVRAARPLPWVIGSGMAFGLALLTKSPAMIMLPFIGLLWFGLYVLERSDPTHNLLTRTWHGLRWSVPQYLLWLLTASIVVFALWPALWVAPQPTLTSYFAEVIDNGGRPNGDGQFFLGRADADPGPLFYLISSVYRLTPLETIGLLAATLASGIALARRTPWTAERTVFVVLLLFLLWWGAIMTNGPKKFDRYVLPVWPALLVFSAAGLTWLVRRFRQPWAASLALPLLVVVLQGAVLAWYHPYYLSYFNPLLGGSSVAPRLFLIGWGEGMNEVGRYLRERRDATGGQIISALPPTLQPFVDVPVQEIRAIDRAQANYAVVYLESIQRGDVPEIYARIQQTLPLHEIRIHDIPYAWIHQLPRPFATSLDAEFAPGLRLHGYTLEQTADQLIFTPSWDVRAALPADLLLFAHLYAADGTRVAQIDVPPGGADLPPTSRWQPGEQVGVPLPMVLPQNLPPGTYALAVGLYDPQSGQRLDLVRGPPADAAVAGAHALQIAVVLNPPAARALPTQQKTP
jgi:4-amino-4-deoxy-L-arabinose transferase-like glycosyltransferase